MVNQSVKTNKFMEQALQAHFLSTNSPPTKMWIGDGTTSPSISDTALTRKIPVNNTESVDDCEVTTGWNAGTDSAVSLNSTTYKEGSNSISLAKSGTTGTTMSMSKTTTSLDFTSKDFWAWVYIINITDLVATGTALTIRFGSDSSNYYYLDVAIGSLSDGWNYIAFNTSTITGTTGSPVIGSCDYTYFAFNTELAADTIVADRIMIDDIKLASSTDYDIGMVASYPAVDTTELQSETRSQLTTTMANGSSFTESGEIDDSNNLQSHHVFDDESKENTDIYFIVEKTKFRMQK